MFASQRTGQVRHHPPRVEHHGFVFVHVVQQELAFAESSQGLLHLLLVKIAGAYALETFHQPCLVALRLDPANQPGAGVGETAVVDIDRVLGRQHEAKPEGPRLLQQREQQLLGRRVLDRRHVAEDLVHVEDRSQARRARLRAHPGDQLV